MMGVVDDDGDGLVTTDGGYVIMDLELKWANKISMLAIVVKVNDESVVGTSVWVCEQRNVVWMSEFGLLVYSS